MRDYFLNHKDPMQKRYEALRIYYKVVFFSTRDNSCSTNRCLVSWLRGVWIDIKSDSF